MTIFVKLNHQESDLSINDSGFGSGADTSYRCFGYGAGFGYDYGNGYSSGKDYNEGLDNGSSYGYGNGSVSFFD